jgi:GrpB-like predicted nucleotidyltransferase (UPF0157 family)
MSSLVEAYRPEWARAFAELKTVLQSALGDLAIEIHHVGSTSIPGMPAKPILDIDVEAPDDLPIEIISAKLRSMGYTYEGDKGVPGRYAYARESGRAPRVEPPRDWMNHHLYVAPTSARELKRHLHFRDSLVASPELREEYRHLKEHCVSLAGNDRKIYQALKDGSPFFERVLSMRPIDHVVDRAAAMLEENERLLECGQISEAEWYRAVSFVITPAYLSGDNPRSQSGHSGDDARWTRARSLIAEAVDRPGRFLDVGCASGYLMECIRRWANERGFAIEPHGLDIAPELAALARHRLPHWADRIHVGNILDWRPDRRFEFVRTGLEYVPARRRRDLIEHLLHQVVAPGGRLIIGTYNEARASLTRRSLEETVTSWGFIVGGRTSRPHPDCRIEYRVFWINLNAGRA